MALFGLFGGKHKAKGYPSPWLQLTVVYAIARDGLTPEDAFALRGRVIMAKPIDFEYKSPDAFLAFFPATVDGLNAGTALADGLREVAGNRALQPFGVGVLQGECLAQRSGSGRFVAKPAGTVIGLAMNAAKEEADAGAK